MKKQKNQRLKLWPVIIVIACLLILVLIISIKIKPVIYDKKENNNIEAVVNTADWVTFKDKSLGISFKHPVDAFINGAGPGTEASNAVTYKDSFVEYMPLNYSYYSDFSKYYGKRNLQEVAELFYKTNIEDDNANIPVNRFISRPEKINLGGVEAYQMSIESGIKYPSGINYHIDGRHKLTFLGLGDKKIVLDSKVGDLVAEEILKTFNFINDNQAISNENNNEIAVNREDLKYLGYGYYTDEKNIYYIYLEWDPNATRKLNPEDMADFNFFDEKNRDLFIENTPSKLEGVDFDSFVTLNKFCGMGNCEGVAKDKNYIYVGNMPKSTPEFSLSKADVKTFQYLKYNFYKDKNALYYYGMGWGRADFVDLATFEFINPMYSKDKNNVYQFVDGFNIIKGANPKTFVVPNN